MQFRLAKKEHQCTGCQGIISYGEEMLVITLRHRNIGETLPHMFHIKNNCYLSWSEENYTRLLLNWRQTVTQIPERKSKPRKKEILGRPRIFSHPVIAARLRSLIYYYKSKNPEKTLELMGQLEDLKKGILPVNLTSRQIGERDKQEVTTPAQQEILPVPTVRYILYNGVNWHITEKYANLSDEECIKLIQAKLDTTTSVSKQEETTLTSPASSPEPTS